jgi:hypothetical protein
MQSEPTITATWPEGAIPAATFAALLGISMAGLRLAVKNAAPPMARLLPGTPVTWPVVEAVLLELGFVKKTAEDGLEGLAGFDVADFVEKARGGAATAAPEATEKPAAGPQPLMVTLVAQCPNPLFWRAKLAVAGQARMVTMKEPLAQKRARFRPGLMVKVWPLAFPTDHFTTVAPKGGA